jgi:hypothetical protein
MIRIRSQTPGSDQQSLNPTGSGSVALIEMQNQAYVSVLVDRMSVFLKNEAKFLVINGF